MSVFYYYYYYYYYYYNIIVCCKYICNLLLHLSCITVSDTICWLPHNPKVRTTIHFMIFPFIVLYFHKIHLPTINIRIWNSADTFRYNKLSMYVRTIATINVLKKTRDLHLSLFYKNPVIMHIFMYVVCIYVCINRYVSMYVVCVYTSVCVYACMRV